MPLAPLKLSMERSTCIEDVGAVAPNVVAGPPTTVPAFLAAARANTSRERNRDVFCWRQIPPPGGHTGRVPGSSRDRNPSRTPPMTATEAARRIADLFWELEQAGIEISGHWSGDLIVARKDRVDLHSITDAEYWSGKNYAGLGFEVSSECGFWKEEYPQQDVRQSPSQFARCNWCSTPWPREDLRKVGALLACSDHCARGLS